MNEWINKRTLQQQLALYIDDYETRKKINAVIDAIPDVSLIGRDEGKEPRLENRKSMTHTLYADGTGEFKNTEYMDWVCPTCGWSVGELYSGHGRWHIQGERTYCASCGQKIDWTKPSEEEKEKYEEYKKEERRRFEEKHRTHLDNMNEAKRRKYGMLGEDK